MKTKPLVTFYVIACNQEHLVGEAVAGALAQTYSPLEVLLSDDCSDDNTYEVMCRLARDYKGPHIVTLRRNETRLGVGAHINAIVKAAKGEWIVASAGDDVSLPERTEVLYALWFEHGSTAGLIYTNITEVKEDGTLWYARDFRKEVPGGCPDALLCWNYHERLSGKFPPVHGAAFAYPKSTFDDLGPLWAGIVFEDDVLNRRAEIRGGILLCNRFLVRHRNHTHQITNTYSKHALVNAVPRRRMLDFSRARSAQQNSIELEMAIERGWVDPLAREKLRSLITLESKKYCLKFEVLWGSYCQRITLLIKNWNYLKHQLRLTECLFIVFPRQLYVTVLKLVAMAK